MNKLSLLILILLFANNCSINKKKSFWNSDKTYIDKTNNVKTILTKQPKEENELNFELEIKVSDGKFSKKFNNNQNNVGEWKK